MDYAESLTALKRYGFNDKDPLRTWLNSGKDDVMAAAEWAWKETVVGIIQPQGQYEVELPDNFKHLVKLTDVTDGRWVPMEYYDVRKWYREVNEIFTIPRKPEIFTLFARRLVAFPSYSGDRTFDLLYTAFEPDLDGSDPAATWTIIPPELHYAVVIKAAATGLMAENEEDRAQTALVEFQDKISKEMDQDVKQSGEPEGVEDTAGYYGEV